MHLFATMVADNHTASHVGQFPSSRFTLTQAMHDVSICCHIMSAAAEGFRSSSRWCGVSGDRCRVRRTDLISFFFLYFCRNKPLKANVSEETGGKFSSDPCWPQAKIENGVKHHKSPWVSHVLLWRIQLPDDDSLTRGCILNHCAKTSRLDDPLSSAQ